MTIRSQFVRLLEGNGEEVKAHEEHLLILTLVMEKKSSRDRNQRGMSISWPKTGIMLVVIVKNSKFVF